MTFTPKHEPMTDWDWHVIGGKKARRLDIPMPDTKDGLFNICRVLYSLHEQIHALARDEAAGTQLAMLSAGNLIRLKNLELKEIAKGWERDLRKARVAGEKNKEELRQGSNIRVVKSA